MSTMKTEAEIRERLDGFMKLLGELARNDVKTFGKILYTTSATAAVCEELTWVLGEHQEGEDLINQALGRTLRKGAAGTSP